MATRQNFSGVQRRSAFEANAEWLQRHRVSGVEIAEPFRALHAAGKIYYCENCLFCHTERKFFDVDHLVPDRSFREWGKHSDARETINMVILCKSRIQGDLGCNQSKGSRNYVPSYRGLAFTHQEIDMNYVPVHERPFDWARAG
jgi:hypothetical protein